jgi:hypothetical protein
MLKYHIYVSATKVEMLFPQVPPRFLQAAEAELGINLGVLTGSLKGGSPEQSSALTGKLKVLDAYIRKHEKVGSVLSPGAWFAGNELLRWGVVEEYASDIALFTGSIGATTLALLGSSESIIGARETAESKHDPFYYTLKFFNSVVADGELTNEEPTYHSWPEAIEIGAKALPDSATRVEFLARTLHVEDGLVVGTPLYVALA